MSIRRHLRLVDKLMLLTAFAVAASLFLSVGWMAVAPSDPQGAVSLLTHENPALMVVEALALAAVTASLATLIAGTRLPDVGIFAVALGLALTSIRGGTATYLLITMADGDSGAERLLAGQLAGEALIWTGVVFLSMVISGWVARHFQNGQGRSAFGSMQTVAFNPPVQLTELAATECPGVARRLGVNINASQPLSVRLSGIKTTLVTALVAIFVFNILVSGRLPQSIKHGQVIFAVIASFFLGVWVSKMWFACRTAFWSLLAVPIVAVLGYSWAVSANATGGKYAGLANVPMSDFLRATPIAFIASGAMGVLIARWMLADPEPLPEEKPVSQKPKRKRNAK
ncbi:MAG: hypothetical protein R3E58_20190 [Phycisphaerae bacterium]